MNLNLVAGSVLSYAYTAAIGKIPCLALRRGYLRAYLAAIGEGTSVQLGCRFLNGRKVYLGERNVINFNCLFDGRKYSIQTGADVSIGPEAAILTLGHDPQSAEFADQGGDVIIGDRVWIAYRAIILPGVTLGEGAVVGAGSVVTQDVAPYTIVAGNPARFIKPRSPDLKYTLNYQPLLL
ncbi:MAG: DapH/DapD/GlmU-related protein [Kovacikia sp.]